jgi:hypothetical protein
MHPRIFTGFYVFLLLDQGGAEHHSGHVHEIGADHVDAHLVDSWVIHVHCMTQRHQRIDLGVKRGVYSGVQNEIEVSSKVSALVTLSGYQSLKDSCCCIPSNPSRTLFTIQQ